jgi:HSP20 family molecular chaperone IbpA
MSLDHNEVTKSNAPTSTQPVHEITPLVDIYENEHELLILSDLPGVTPDKLSVEVDHPELKIQGRAANASRGTDRLYTRTFRLDASVDVAKIEAKISEGVLEVHLPKSEPYRVRKIDVTGS